MTKDMYKSKLLLLKMQVDNMLMEGEEDAAAAGIPSGGAVAASSGMVNMLYAQAKWWLFSPLTAASSVWTMFKHVWTNHTLKGAFAAGWGTFKEIGIVKACGWFAKDGAIMKGLAAAGGAIASAPIAAAVIIGSIAIGGGTMWYRSGTYDRVKEATAKALSNGNLSDLSKHVNTLKKISKQGFWNSLINHKEGRELAAGNVAGIRKGYIAAGIGLILVSLLSVVVLANNMNVIGPLNDAIKKLDFKGIISALGDLLMFGFALIPAIIGICFISVARSGFENVEGSIAGKILTVFSPVVSFANKVILGTLETLNAKTISEQESHIKKLNYTKRRH